MSMLTQRKERALKRNASRLSVHFRELPLESLNVGRIIGVHLEANGHSKKLIIQSALQEGGFSSDLLFASFEQRVHEHRAHATLVGTRVFQTRHDQIRDSSQVSAREDILVEDVTSFFDDSRHTKGRGQCALLHS